MFISNLQALRARKKKKMAAAAQIATGLKIMGAAKGVRVVFAVMVASLSSPPCVALSRNALEWSPHWYRGEWPGRRQHHQTTASAHLAVSTLLGTRCSCSENASCRTSIVCPSLFKMVGAHVVSSLLALTCAHASSSHVFCGACRRCHGVG
jgi:hypothetical protein